ncbi:MAG: AAA family ATPase, partial [Deltaproteobacteria bacterium]|nr:AAA family ATPase [Deltaproteobacteria bacterium]
MDKNSDRIPGPRELEKELNDYLAKKYGKRIKLGVSSGLFPQPDLSLPDGESEEGKKSGGARLSFDLKPEELEAYLDEYIIKQRKAKEILATKICTHYNRIKYFERTQRYSDLSHVGYVKNNIIMIGPTGVGKTYLVKLIADKIGVPFVKGDATKFSETGYVGGDIEDLVRDLVSEADGDIELAQYGIIYLDEVDKIASSQNFLGPDVSRAGVQRGLLKPMEETEVELKVPHDIVSQMEALDHYRKTGKRERRRISTRNILFIMSGAFNGLEDIIKKRLNRQGMGFGAEIHSRNDTGDLLSYVKAEDLISYGFESEFIGRLPVVAVFDQLDASDLYAILANRNNPIIRGKKKDFKSYDINIQFENEALEKIAGDAFRERTGARGLVSALERVTIPFEKRLPSTTISRLTITPKMVNNPYAELEKLLRVPDEREQKEKYEKLAEVEALALKDYLYQRKEEFVNRYGFFFDEDVIDIITHWAME